jgi:hypothetical protein
MQVSFGAFESRPTEVTFPVNDRLVQFCHADGTPVPTVRREPRKRPARVVCSPRRRGPRARGAGRPRGQAARSSARSGDSGDDSESAAGPGWRWASTDPWLAFVASIYSRDFEREIAREREAGWSL